MAGYLLDTNRLGLAITKKIERIRMAQQVVLKLELPGDLERFRLPRGVDERLHGLLDRQARGDELTRDERREAEGLVDLAELLSLLKLRTQRAG